MWVKQYKNVLKKNEEKFFQEQVMSGNDCPFYLNTEDVGKSKRFFPFFTHIVLHRPEDSAVNKINSPSYNYLTKLFKNFSKRCNFKYNKIYRICFKITFNNGTKQSSTHLDHQFPHKQLILYLHIDDLKSHTCVYNKEETKIKKINPIPNSVAIWNNLKHYHITPTKGYRLVLIYTFL